MIGDSENCVDELCGWLVEWLVSIFVIFFFISFYFLFVFSYENFDLNNWFLFPKKTKTKTLIMFMRRNETKPKYPQ